MYTNALIHETSPYLLQHAHNPVDWYPWGDEALAKAKKENKMLLISVGYAACHWCHVMEHESYEDTVVANIMNKNFVCIKVDREERPDVDQVYMNAAYLINGNGGWPLNALVMPDGKPFFAGTYFPKDKWIQLLKYFSDLYKNQKQKLEEQADHLSKGINDIENVPKNTTSVSFSAITLDDMFSTLSQRIDMDKGGTKGSMKFPMPAIWEYLLQYYYFNKNTNALKAVEITLQHMAYGGIYDQVGGGFSRYATDPNWHAPHFEKMLYDNAQLVSLYSHAFQLTKNSLYKRIVYETIAFVKRELTSPEGGFYSSLDADSEGEEGKFYVWSKDEIKEILGSDAEIFSDYFGITSKGNWEPGKNIPDIIEGEKDIEKKYDLSADQLQNKIDELKLQVLKARGKRIRPQTDDKILTAWNALMTKGLIDAYEAFDEKDFLQMAETNIGFLLKNISTKENALYRNYKNGKATIPAFLDDYSFMISALIDYYQVNFNENYLQKANDLTQYVEQHFYDKTTGMYFYTDDQHSNLIARKMEVPDNVIPSSNSEMAKNLLLLGLYFENNSYESQSAQLVKNVIDDIKKNPSYYSNWAQVVALQIKPPYEVAILGNDWQQKLSEFHKQYLPNTIYLGGVNEGNLSLLQNKLVSGKTFIYVCENKTCQLPVESVEAAMKQIK
ncbi:thioredoxin domain-containing protein [Ginsengibacter hankyongi]|uniref:Thioredoxin domain-containing protein n=2 Tax=Ginsengibacter hankyongi TaxID=2607284 RepID=A0A5J5IC80_9BACT|nr:thioredoxin domain-containing protein [Ginsengibacter hankyongi]